MFLIFLALWLISLTSLFVFLLPLHYFSYNMVWPVPCHSLWLSECVFPNVGWGFLAMIPIFCRSLLIYHMSCQQINREGFLRWCGLNYPLRERALYGPVHTLDLKEGIRVHSWVHVIIAPSQRKAGELLISQSSCLLPLHLIIKADLGEVGVRSKNFRRWL